MLGSIQQSTKSSSNSAQETADNEANESPRIFYPLLRKFFDPKCSRMGRVLSVALCQ